MQFGTVAHEGTTHAAARTADGWRALPAADLSAHLAAGGTLGPDTPLGELLPGAEPVAPLPRPGKVICCGLNYGDHILETGPRAARATPRCSPSTPTRLVGPVDDIALPDGTDVDWEAELAVVVGATIRGADRATAAAAIAGYTVANDVSVRDWQNRTLQWFQGKAWDALDPDRPRRRDPRRGRPARGA